jgi:hypothetical protein
MILKGRIARLALGLLAVGLEFVGPSAVDASNVQFTAEVPNGSLNFGSLLSWNVWNADQFGPAYEIDLNPGQTANNIVSSMRTEMDSFANPFSGDGSVSGNTLTVDTATSGDFWAAGEVSMSMTVMPPTLPPGSVPDLPLLFKPHEIPVICCAVGFVVFLLEGVDGQPVVPAGGNGTLVATVDVDGASAPVVATVGFSAADTTADIVQALDAVFSSATLSPGATYAGVFHGSPVFYTDDLRPLSAGFSVMADAELNFRTGAVIYYVPEPSTAALLLVAAVGLVSLRPFQGRRSNAGQTI